MCGHHERCLIPSAFLFGGISDFKALNLALLSSYSQEGPRLVLSDLHKKTYLGSKPDGLALGPVRFKIRGPQLIVRKSYETLECFSSGFIPNFQNYLVIF